MWQNCTALVQTKFLYRGRCSNCCKLTSLPLFGTHFKCLRHCVLLIVRLKLRPLLRHRLLDDFRDNVFVRYILYAFLPNVWFDFDLCTVVNFGLYRIPTLQKLQTTRRALHPFPKERRVAWSYSRSSIFSDRARCVIWIRGRFSASLRDPSSWF